MLHGIPALVDEMEGVNAAYTAWPDQAKPVGLEGETVYARGTGPFGFWPAERRKAVDDYLGSIGCGE